MMFSIQENIMSFYLSSSSFCPLITFHIFLTINPFNFIFLFIFGCIGSSLLCGGFL